MSEWFGWEPRSSRERWTIETGREEGQRPRPKEGFDARSVRRTQALIFPEPGRRRRSSAIRWRYQRQSGDLARHVWTTCSSDGGVSGWNFAMGSGSFSRMAEATEIWLLPSNA